jgi:two-component system NtrC family response regulator
MASILVIDDDPDISDIITQLAEDLGHTVQTVPALAQGLDIVRGSEVDLVFLDVRLPDGSGLNMLPAIRNVPAMPEVIIITGLGDPDGAELAIQNGAWDYIEKTSTLKQIAFSMERALRYRETSRMPRTHRLKRDNLVGESPAMRGVLESVAIAALGDASVLITGHTGTGKEVVARTIHDNSARSAAPFVVVDCAALSEHLVEGELFGHVRGSFTGAHSSRMGLVEQADGGTLFLDEVGELPQTIQAAFLRVLQEKRFRPVGSSSERTSDFRLIAATNRDLEGMCEAGQFRTDLFFRIKACAIHMPQLKDRLEDVPALVRYHMKRLCTHYDVGEKELSDDILSLLLNYDWPGNVREMVQVIERTLMRSFQEKILYPEHLPVDIRAKAARRAVQRTCCDAPDCPEQPDCDSFSSTLLQGGVPLYKEYRKACLEQAEAKYFARLMQAAGNDVREACRISGMSRTRLYEMLKIYRPEK